MDFLKMDTYDLSVKNCLMLKISPCLLFFDKILFCNQILIAVFIFNEIKRIFSLTFTGFVEMNLSV